MNFLQIIRKRILQTGNCRKGRGGYFFYAAGESKIELLEASNPESPISKFIEKREKASIIWHLV
jgi:hypothetical protein